LRILIVTKWLTQTVHWLTRLSKKRVTDLPKQQARLLELAYDAIIVRDLEGGIRFWNRGVESLYASSKEEVMDSLSHKLLRTSFPCPFKEIQLQLIEAGHRGGKPHPTHRSLDSVIASSRWAVRTGDDGRIEVMDINRDTTAQKKIEEHLRDMNLELERLVGGLRRAEEKFRGLLEEEDRARGLALVAARFLIRFIDPEELLKEIEACLQEAESCGENSDC
jgi:PAS domain S-box-containing protein